MSSFNAEASVGAIVREHPALASLFESLQIDYCCGGQHSLADACARQGLDLEATLTALQHQAKAAADGADGPRPCDLSLSELTVHIETRHHAYLHAELPLLRQRALKVAAVHGDRDPRLHQISALVSRLADDLELHLRKEETILFPMIRRLEAGDDAPAASAALFPCSTVAGPIQRMETEHQEAGAALEQLRQLSDHYSPPAWACATYRALLDGLARFEQDMHEHVHKENNVLFPRAIALEQQRAEN
jgi:regulator of cell morphogenesis and NO signaling